MLSSLSLRASQFLGSLHVPDPEAPDRAVQFIELARASNNSDAAAELLRELYRTASEWADTLYDRQMLIHAVPANPSLAAELPAEFKPSSRK